MSKGTKLNYSAVDTASGQQLFTVGAAELIGTLQVRFGASGPEYVSLVRSDGSVETLPFSCRMNDKGSRYFSLWFGHGGNVIVYFDDSGITGMYHYRWQPKPDGLVKPVAAERAVVPLRKSTPSEGLYNDPLPPDFAA